MSLVTCHPSQERKIKMDPLKFVVIIIVAYLAAMTSMAWAVSR